MKSFFSITSRLFWGFTALLLTALGVLAVAATLWFVQQESESLNRFLDSEAKVVSNRLQGMMEGLAISGTFESGDARRAMQRDIKTYLDERVNRPIPYKTTLLILDDQGNVIGESNQALDLTGPMPGIAPGETEIHDVTDRGPPYRVLTAKFPLGSQSFGTFRIASLVSSLTSPLWSFLTSLGLLVLGSLLALLVLGSGLIVAVLRPIRSMAEAATAISEQNLGARIPLPPGNDDFVRLGRTLNALLSRLETEFTYQERLVGELTHQLKTPLTILRGRNELGLVTRKEAQEFRELIEDNLSDIDSMGNLLNSILELARFESRIDRLKTVEVNLRELVADLGSELDPLWSSKQFEFRSQGPDISILADLEALRQILMNLFDNAWKYGTPGTEIATEWMLTATHVRIVVSNWAPPIPDDDLELIFKRFYRSAQGHQRATGSGLGLSIVRSLAQLHGATVRALNEPPYVCFEVLWPLPPAESMN